MKQKTKITRKVLILTFLLVSLVVVGSETTRYASATTCSEAYQNYLNADFTYYSARMLFFHDDPTTCAYECRNITDPVEKQQCISDCEINRETAMYSAELDMFAKAEMTCAPETVEQCSQARQLADQCAIDYNYQSYSDPDESDAVYWQYVACIEASKIDTCQ